MTGSPRLRSTLPAGLPGTATDRTRCAALQVVDGDDGFLYVRRTGRRTWNLAAPAIRAGLLVGLARWNEHGWWCVEGQDDLQCVACRRAALR